MTTDLAMIPVDAHREERMVGEEGRRAAPRAGRTIDHVARLDRAGGGRVRHGTCASAP
jgi:hypothetical protein